MVKPLILIDSEAERERAISWCFRAELGSRVIFEAPQRSSEGNARMWALLTRISEELEWQGQHYSPAQWKDYFMHEFCPCVWMPAEGGGFIPVGRSTGELKGDERKEFILLILDFATRQGLDLSLARETAARA